MIVTVELRVLGPVELRVDGRPVEIGHARQRCVLAVLLMEANRVVTMEQLLDRVWADRLPHKARQVASNYVSRLRQVLADGVAIARHGGGYVLHVDPEAVDVHRFHRLVGQARGQDDAQALASLQEAAGLWRGEAFEGLDTPWIAAVREGLARERFAADADRADLALAQGAHAALCAELAERADAHPLDERVAAQLMLALYRNGRQAEALLRFDRIRARLADEVGADPGPELRDLHRRMLDTDPALDRAPGRDGTAPVPRQLPAPPAFTGRGAELTLLDKALAEASGTVLISAIGGAGGIGKTWLALTWAHQHAERFPDGQLFVDLHGFSPTEQPLPPEVAVRGFLDALDADPARIPADPGAQAALYRSLVAGRRMLIVLDNAATAEQVVPLLPGSPDCTVLVTGRGRLASLIDRHGARHLQLDVLARDEARALLAARLGADRVAAEPGAADELIDLCGGYPLALSITARNAAGLPLAEIAADLREFGLDALDHDSDPAASLPAVLSGSLRRLTGEQRTVFALLGIAPGPDTTLPAVAALTGLPRARARKALSALEEASLLERRPGGRYAMHDLVRAYATTVAHDLPHDVRETALVRVLDFHLHTAFAASRLLEPARQFVLADPPAPGVEPHPLPDAAAAMAWLEAEQAVLLAAQRAAAVLGRHHVVWHLARLLDVLHYRRGHLHDALGMWRVALDAAAQLPDPLLHGRTHRYLGNLCSLLDLPDEATAHLDQALALAVRHDDLTEQAYTHQTLARAQARRGDARQALGQARHALDLYRALGHPAGEADALNQMGWYAARLEDFEAARGHCHAALALHREQADPAGEADTLDSLAFIAHRTGDHRQAIVHYRESLALFRALDDTCAAADALDSLGHPHVALGEHEQARVVWREALELYRDQGRDDDATRVRRRLDDLTTAPDE